MVSKPGPHYSRTSTSILTAQEWESEVELKIWEILDREHSLNRTESFNKYLTLKITTTLFRFQDSFDDDQRQSTPTPTNNSYHLYQFIHKMNVVYRL